VYKALGLGLPSSVVRSRAAWRLSAPGENRCDAAAYGRRRDWRAGEGLFVLAAPRAPRASALELARHLLDRTGRRRAAQGTADPDVRRADDRHARDPRSQCGLAVAAATGVGPDVDAGAGAAVVRCDLLARGRNLPHRFLR